MAEKKQSAMAEDEETDYNDGPLWLTTKTKTTRESIIEIKSSFYSHVAFPLPGLACSLLLVK